MIPTLDSWIISDTHFGHNNIVRLCGRPMNHNDLMLARWEEMVQGGDVVLHLGDLYWKDWRTWTPILKRLPGRKYLIRGNHDKQTATRYAAAGFEVIPAFVHGLVAYTHRPVTNAFQEVDPHGWSTNIHGHVHNNFHREAEGAKLDRRYINASVEVTDYRPRRLGELLR